MNKFKRVFLFFVFICICVLIMMFFSKKESDGEIRVDSLSSRAEEFIAEQNKDGSGEWSGVTFSDQELSEISEVGMEVRTPCFSLLLPVKTVRRKVRQDGQRCVFEAKSVDPFAQLVISAYPSTGPEDDGGIMMRKNQEKIYSEKLLTHELFDEVVMYYGEHEATLFAYTQGEMLTVAFSELQHPEQFGVEPFLQILNSVQLTATVAPEAE